jgi:hypothetical protein
MSPDDERFASRVSVPCIDLASAPALLQKLFDHAQRNSVPIRNPPPGSFQIIVGSQDSFCPALTSWWNRKARTGFNPKTQQNQDRCRLRTWRNMTLARRSELKRLVDLDAKLGFAFRMAVEK